MKQVTWGKNTYHIYYQEETYINSNSNEGWGFKPVSTLSDEELKIIQNTLKGRKKCRKLGHIQNSRIYKRAKRLKK